MCSLSTFDAYLGSRVQKAPKPFVFAVKSTDPITLFENKSDYMHMFCCSEEGGWKWMENIMLAKVRIASQVVSFQFCLRHILRSPISCTKRSTYYLLGRNQLALRRLFTPLDRYRVQALENAQRVWLSLMPPHSFHPRRLWATRNHHLSLVLFLQDGPLMFLAEHFRT